MRHGATMPDDLPKLTTKQRPAESAKAEEAFADYVALGPSRSLRALAAVYVKQGRYKSETTAFNAVAHWSGKFRWQERLAEAASARSTALLEQAAELDADTFRRSSELLNERMHYSHPGDTEVVIKMRESVRKPAPKGGASVSVNVSVEVRHMAERMAEELGLDAEQLIRDAEDIAAREWSKA